MSLCCLPLQSPGVRSIALSDTVQYPVRQNDSHENIIKQYYRCRELFLVQIAAVNTDISAHFQQVWRKKKRFFFFSFCFFLSGNNVDVQIPYCSNEQPILAPNLSRNAACSLASIFKMWCSTYPTSNSFTHKGLHGQVCSNAL